MVTKLLHGIKIWFLQRWELNSEKAGTSKLKISDFAQK